MHTINDAALLEASSLTAKQFEEAINIVEAEFGLSLEGSNNALIGGVLDTLARNYEIRLRELLLLPPPTELSAGSRSTERLG